MRSKVVIKESDIHHHLQMRMQQRGVSLNEIEITMNEGWEAVDGKEGTIGKVFVFPYNNYWAGSYFEEIDIEMRS